MLVSVCFTSFQLFSGIASYKSIRKVYVIGEHMRFTDRQLQSLKPLTKEYTLNEGRGFILIVSPSGAKTFYYRYRREGKLKKVHLGVYPFTTLSEARDKFGDASKAVRRGENPVPPPTPPEPVPPSVVTVGQMMDSYKDWSETNHSDEWWRIVRSTLDKYLTDWRSRDITTIRKTDAIELMEHITKVGGAGAAKNALKVIQGVFTYTLERDKIVGTPFIKLTRAVPSLKITERDRALSEREIKHVWRAIQAGRGSESVKRALSFILITGQRPGEVAGLHTREIDGDWWTIPPERNEKGKRYHRVYITGTAKGIIGEVKGFVFGGRYDKTPLTERSLSQIVVKNCYYGLARWTPHDLRRTMRTHIARLGVINEHAEAVINHAKEGMDKVYNQYQYDAEKREALIKWETELLHLISDEPPEQI